MLLAPNLLVFQILGEQIFALDVILPSGETSSISLSLNRHICAIVCFSEKKKKSRNTDKTPQAFTFYVHYDKTSKLLFFICQIKTYFNFLLCL